MFFNLFGKSCVQLIFLLGNNRNIDNNILRKDVCTEHVSLAVLLKYYFKIQNCITFYYNDVLLSQTMTMISLQSIKQFVRTFDKQKKLMCTKKFLSEIFKHKKIQFYVSFLIERKLLNKRLFAFIISPCCNYLRNLKLIFLLL